MMNLPAPKDLRGATAIVVGLGVSGEASARLLAAKGARVIATDLRARVAIAECANRLEKQGVFLILGGHTGIDLPAADLVVVSPGVPSQPWLRNAERRGARLVSEIELASWFVDADVIAVGGTNGKSTTTELAAALCATSARPVFAGGNLGVPLAQAVVDGHPGISRGGVCVVEVSSFQMERVAGFRPKASILLNITPDHLDRYPSFEAYANAKGGAFRAQSAGDVAIVPYGDALSARIARLGGAALELVDGPAAEATVGLEGDSVVDRISKISILRSEIRLIGRHNITNLCAAWAAARAVGLDPSRFPDAIRAFDGLLHRTALVANIGGVCFYDDSKGTNVGASVTALEGLAEARAVLVAGGRDKGGSYAPLIEALRRRGRGLVVIGEAAAAIAEAARLGLGVTFPIVHARTMEEAVDFAARLAQSGDAVLLSPACSSFDMFRDYKHRGDAFTAAVRARVGGAR